MQTRLVFTDRIEAGQRLAEELEYLRDEDLVVLGLPRGGVPVAAEVAEHLDAPIDVIVVRKLGVPFQPELGMGAIGEDGVKIINREVMANARLSDAEMVAVEQHQRAELDRQARLFRSGRPRVPVAGRTALIIDDGVATGSTARAACQVARAHGASRVILAVPVAPIGWADRIGADADETIALSTPEGFQAVGQWYEDFHAVPDHEVVACLGRLEHLSSRISGADGLGSGRVSDPYLARASEDAEGTTAYRDAYADDATIVQREEAEGVELFEDPDHVVSTLAVREGSPGHETLVGDDIGRPNVGEDRRSED